MRLAISWSAFQPKNAQANTTATKPSANASGTPSRRSSRSEPTIRTVISSMLIRRDSSPGIGAIADQLNEERCGLQREQRGAEEERGADHHRHGEIPGAAAALDAHDRIQRMRPGKPAKTCEIDQAAQQ